MGSAAGIQGRQRQDLLHPVRQASCLVSAPATPWPPPGPFSYLLFFRALSLLGLPTPTPFTNAVQLLLTLKVRAPPTPQPSLGAREPAQLTFSSLGRQRRRVGLSHSPA